MHASIGQYSMQAGDPAQPVQQSVVIARMRGLRLRVALPSPTDIGQCFSMTSIMQFPVGAKRRVTNVDTLTRRLGASQQLYLRALARLEFARRAMLFNRRA